MWLVSKHLGSPLPVSRAWEGANSKAVWAARAHACTWTSLDLAVRVFLEFWNSFQRTGELELGELRGPFQLRPFYDSNLDLLGGTARALSCNLKTDCCPVLLYRMQQQKCCPSPSTRTLKREAHHIFWFPLAQVIHAGNTIITKKKKSVIPHGSSRLSAIKTTQIQLLVSCH